MATAAPAGSAPLLGFPPESVWRAPLLPVALAVSAGLLVNRYISIPLEFGILFATCALLAWAVTAFGRRRGLGLTYLWIAAASASAAYDGWRRGAIAGDDVSLRATDDPVPATLRGTVEADPQPRPGQPADPLRSFPVADSFTFVLSVKQIKAAGGWERVSGRVQVYARGRSVEPRVGDEIEIVGRLSRPAPAANPGEANVAALLADRGIRAVLSVEGAGSLTVLREGSAWAPRRLFADLRRSGLAALREALPPGEASLGAVLLLGDNSALQREEWEQYQRSGVVHVLAISGQHLAILGGFLWIVLRVARVPRRRGAVLVAFVLLTYAAVAGFRTPVIRATVAALVFCGSLFARRPLVAANTLALGWLVVVLWDPAEAEDPGCQLSFLAVAVLIWVLRLLGDGDSADDDPDPIARTIDESRPAWLRVLRGAGKLIAFWYAVSAAVWIALAPLIAARYHMITPGGLLLSPPAVVLTTVALIAGFLFFLASAVWLPLAQPFAWVTANSLAACDAMVGAVIELPGAYWYVGDIPRAWLWVFYAGLLAALTLEGVRKHWHWAVTAGLAWLCVGLALAAVPPPSREFRCTFLAVGHGGCTVIETPDGRTLLYDVGAMSGPEIVRRHVAPFLWSRGVRRIDEVFLSHADLDHYNGLKSLMERFRVAQVSCSPTFRARNLAAVRLTLEELRRRSVPVRELAAGQRLTAGAVTLDVLHPPAHRIDGTENERSLVLLVQHGPHRVLLTGDLEGGGLQEVLTRPMGRVDVMMAPHHGSAKANTAALAEWARPRLVVSCQGRPLSSTDREAAYREVGASYLGTWPHGAVAVRFDAAGFTAETFVTKLRWRFAAE